MLFPDYRARRLRQNEIFRRMVRETTLSVDDLILPLFAVMGKGVKDPIPSMPGHHQLSTDNIIKEAKAAPKGFVMPLVGAVCADMGRREKAQLILDELIEEAQRSYVPASSLAALCLGLGKKDQAFQYLEEAYAKADPSLLLLRISPLADCVHADPRFASLLKLVGFDV